MSVITRSGGESSTAWIPSRPLAASIASWPAASTVRRSIMRTWSSSSMINTRAMAASYIVLGVQHTADRLAQLAAHYRLEQEPARPKVHRPFLGQRLAEPSAKDNWDFRPDCLDASKQLRAQHP